MKKEEAFKFEILCAKCDGEQFPEGVDGVIALSKCVSDYSFEELVSFGGQLTLMLEMVREAAKAQARANPSLAIAMARELGVKLDGEEPFQWPEELSEQIN